MSQQKFIQTAYMAAVITLGALSSNAATVAHWNFDGGTAGTAFSAMPAVDNSGNNNTMFGWDPYWGPSYSAATANGYGLSARHDAFHQDGYTAGAPVNSWSPTTWTIELSVRLDSVGGWNTIIGRDNSSQGEPESDFYLQNNGIDDRFRLNFDTVGGQRYVLDSSFVALPNVWYGLAITSDGSAVNMFADQSDGNGYQNVGSLALNGLNNNALSQNNSVWTFGRGWYGGGFVDHISGNLDNIRFSDTVLTTAQLIPVPEPTTLALGGIGAAMLFIRRRRA